jgi:hypothetical protein
MAAYNINGTPLISFTWIAVGSDSNPAASGTHLIKWNIPLDGNHEANRIFWNWMPVTAKLEYVVALMDTDSTGENVINDTYSMKFIYNEEPGSGFTGVGSHVFSGKSYSTSGASTAYGVAPYNISSTGGYNPNEVIIPANRRVSADYTGLSSRAAKEHSFIFYFSQVG